MNEPNGDDEMKTTTFKGEVASAFGKVLPKPVAFEGSYEAYESYDELKAANAIPSNDEILAFVNAQRKANERAKATNEALEKAGIEKPKADDPQVVLRNMIKQLVLAKKDPETARELAENLLGYKLEE